MRYKVLINISLSFNQVSINFFNYVLINIFNYGLIMF